MAKKLLLINLLMMVGVLVLAERLVVSWADFREAEAAGRSVDVAPAASAELDLPLVAGPEPVDPMEEFAIVSQKNLFSDDRGVVADSGEGGQDAEPPPLAVKPKLLSVSLFNGKAQAVLSVFEGTRGSKAESRVVNLGDDVQGYQVSRIEISELGLSWNGNEIHTIPLEAGEQDSRPRVARAQQAVRIITVGAAAAAVETVSVSDAGEDQRGLEVVSAGAAAGPAGRGGQAGQNTRGLSGGGRNQLGGRNSQLGGRNQFGNRGRNSSLGSNRNNQSPIGFGSANAATPNNPQN